METEFDIFRIVAALIKMSTIFKKTIVIYGQDLLLLETRSLLLARFGLHPVAVASLPEVQNIIKSCDLDLLVVCASVPDQIAELLLEEIEKSGKSEIKTLLLREPRSNLMTDSTERLISPLLRTPFNQLSVL